MIVTSKLVSCLRRGRADALPMIPQNPSTIISTRRNIRCPGSGQEKSLCIKCEEAGPSTRRKTPAAERTISPINALVKPGQVC